MHVLFVDLNNFSRYPTLSVGYLASVLREEHIKVDILSPLSQGIQGYPRLTRSKPWELYYNFIKHWTAVTQSRFIRHWRKKIQLYRAPGGQDDQVLVLESLTEFLKKKPDVVLISAYTMYADLCQSISAICAQHAIPVIAGGNSFVVEEVAALWHDMPGIHAVYAGEPELHLLSLVKKVANGLDVSDFPGVYAPGKKEHRVAEPLTALDDVPYPDFSDFPWHAYPNRIVPIMTGRGCEWGRCTFCSDVVTSAGRSFRSRSLENVLGEIEFQASRFNSKLFVFLDLKLNSDVELWRGLIKHLPTIVPGAQWTASVHVDNRQDNGLTKEDLELAAKAGLTRITCGLESASSKLLASMAKGTRIKRVSQFIKDASDAGISVRLTSIVGYPTETSSDVDMTTEFVKEHTAYIERIVLNRFTLMPGTPAEKKFYKQKEPLPNIIVSDSIDLYFSTINYENKDLAATKNLLSVFKLMHAIHKINRKPLMESAREFEGVF